MLCAQSGQILLRPYGQYSVRLLCGIFQARIWSGLSFPTPGDFPKLGLLRFLHRQADSLPLSHQENTPPQTGKINL